MSEIAVKVLGLSHKRMKFVEAYDEHGNVLVSPRIIDKKNGPQDVDSYQEYLLSDTAATIVRLALQNVDTASIAKTFNAEYAMDNLDQAQAVVDGFIAALKTRNLFKEVPLQARSPVDATISEPTKFRGLWLDFSINLNQTGGGGYKIPPR